METVTKYRTLYSRIRKEAYKLMRREFYNKPEFIREIINTYYPKEKTNPQEWYEEYDLYLQCLIQSFYPQALENLLYEWAAYKKFEGDAEEFEKEDYQKIIQENQEEFNEYKKSLFFPTYEKLERFHSKSGLVLPVGLMEVDRNAY